MQRSDWLVGTLAVLAGAMGAATTANGCTANFDDCSKYPKQGCPGFSAGGNTTHSTSSGGGGSGGVDGGPGIDCQGPPRAPAQLDGGSGGAGAQDQGNIHEDCAVFVRADATGASPDGTRTNPYKTLQDALNKAGTKKVYACKSKAFSEAVTLSAGIDVYGGFDCTNPTQWTWKASNRSEINGPADTVAFTIKNGSDGALVSGFVIAGGTPTPGSGKSSIGMAVADVAATIEQCTISAEPGADGADGQTPSDAVTVGQDAPAPDDTAMKACLLPALIAGGLPGVTDCDGVNTSGGVGGKGGIPTTDTDGGAVDSDGLAGESGKNSVDPAGKGGAGQTSSTLCGDGTKGQNGEVGTTGASGESLGVLTLLGITGDDGGDGGKGTPGGGGGGGGGSRSGVFCKSGSNTVDGPGASGGGGGAGGCGGLGGHGGQAGGSSIAMVSLGTKLTIDGKTVILTASNGGNGGAGAAGQNGGKGGNGASGGSPSGTSPSKAGCSGSPGGTGGDGGPGGGGRGGHSVALAYAKSGAAAISFTTPPTTGKPGNAGQGPGTSGAAGTNGAVCDFVKGSCL